MRHYIVLFFIFIVQFLPSQVLTGKQESVIRSTIRTQFGAVADETQLNLSGSSFCIVKKDTFFTPPGYFYLFRMAGDTLERMDHSLFHGGNHRRFLFQWNEKLYMLGGYGFFTTNNNLLAFNVKTREWNFEPTTGDVPPSILGLTFKKDNIIYSLNNFKSGNNATADKIDSSAYVLDLKTMSWKRCAHPNPLALFTGECYYSKDYCLFKGKDRSWIIKPADITYLELGNDELGFQPGSYASSIDQNSVSIVRYRPNGEDTYLASLNLDSVWKQKSANAMPLIFQPVSDHTAVNYNLILFGLVVFVPATGLLFYKRHTKKKTQKSGEAEKISTEQEKEFPVETARFDSNPWVNNILVSGKTLLNTEELDEFLNINFLEGDSKKLRRHRLLSDLEKDAPGLITRVKDESDKRKFLYKITVSA